MVLLQLTALTNKVLASGNNHNASGSKRWIDRTNVRPWRPTHYASSVSRCIDLHSLTVLSSSSHYFDLLIAKVWFLALLTHCHNTKFEDCIAQHFWGQVIFQSSSIAVCTVGKTSIRFDISMIFLLELKLFCVWAVGGLVTQFGSLPWSFTFCHKNHNINYTYHK